MLLLVNNFGELKLIEKCIEEKMKSYVIGIVYELNLSGTT
jgi:hypothetical protein